MYIALIVFVAIFLSGLRVAQEYQRGVVFRLGRYTGIKGPGLFWIIPFVDSVTAWIDQRVITTSFAAEETLTSDTVPVNGGTVVSEMQPLKTSMVYLTESALMLKKPLDLLGDSAMTAATGISGFEHNHKIAQPLDSPKEKSLRHKRPGSSGGLPRSQPPRTVPLFRACPKRLIPNFVVNLCRNTLSKFR